MNFNPSAHRESHISKDYLKPGWQLVPQLQLHLTSQSPCSSPWEFLAGLWIALRHINCFSKCLSLFPASFAFHLSMSYPSYVAIFLSLLKVPNEKLELKLHNWNDTLYITGRHFHPMSPNEPRQATPLLSRANFSVPFSHSTNAYGDLWLEEATHQLPSKTGLALAESQGSPGVTTKPFSYCSICSLFSSF